MFPRLNGGAASAGSQFIKTRWRTVLHWHDLISFIFSTRLGENARVVSLHEAFKGSTEVTLMGNRAMAPGDSRVQMSSAGDGPAEAGNPRDGRFLPARERFEGADVIGGG
jgi:hypothetical protein